MAGSSPIHDSTPMFESLGRKSTVSQIDHHVASHFAVLGKEMHFLSVRTRLVPAIRDDEVCDPLYSIVLIVL